MEDVNNLQTSEQVTDSGVQEQQSDVIPNEEVKPSGNVNEAELAVNDEVLALLSAFAKDSSNIQQVSELKNDPNYQEYLVWKQQQMQRQGINTPHIQQQPQPNPLEQFDYEKVVRDPTEFRNFVTTFNTDIQARISNALNQMLEMSEILYHLKVLEDKYPEITESPTALQTALLKAKSLGLSPREIAEKAVKDYLSAYKIRQNIIKNKNMVNVSKQEPLPNRPITRQEQQKEENPYDYIIRAFNQQ